MMTTQRLKTVLALLGLAAAVALPQARAQSAGSADVQTDDNTVKLPAFEITSEKDTNYVGTSSLSTTRVAVDLAEVPQSIKVLNSSFLQAINPTMMPDILEYVGGGQNGQLNWTPGRLNIRGFTGDTDYVDGFSPPAATALDDTMFDRIEVVKGPSAIFLGTDGSPGGVLNKISKSPQSVPSTEVSVQVAPFDGNHIGVDTTGPLTKDKKLLYRVVLGESYYNGYYDNVYMHRFTSVYALSYQFNANTKLTVKAQLSQINWPSYNGLPIDPRTLAMINLPYNYTQDFGAPLDWRMDDVHRIWGDFNTRFNDHIALSIRGMRAFDRADRHESIAPTWSEGTSTGKALINGVSKTVTFLGGHWTTPATVGTSESVAPVNYYTQNGTIFVTDAWAGTPDYTGGAIPRSTINADDAHTTYNDLQADLNFNYDTKYFKELFLLGGEHRDNPGETETWKTGVSASAWYPYQEGLAGSTVVNYTTPSAYVQTILDQNRFYGLETLKIWDDRIIGSFGASRAFTEGGTFNYLTGKWSTAPYNLTADLIQWGVVVKLMPGVNLFTGFNQNFAPNGTGTLNGVANQVLPPKTGQQHEVGLKTDLLHHRLQFNISYFDIKQQNNTVPSFPSDPNNPNVLIPGVISRGFDGDWSLKLDSDNYLMGSWADYKAKSILGSAYAASLGGTFLQPATDQVAWASIPVDNTAEQTESAYFLHKFQGTYKGLQVGIGENYQSKRAITDGPDQVFFGYIPSRVLATSSISYKYNDHLRYDVTINNLLNKKYIYSSRSEDVIVPGTPFNIMFKVTYSL